ncbi:MAG: metallophosphoesterase family protein, partial [Flammeovirgaceae bacterium]
LAQAQEQIVFVSDTQKPMWVEDLFLPSHHNEKATELIFESIQSVKPKSVFILGDVVSLGHKEKKWKKIDEYLHQLRSSGIEVNALLGNHDVMSKPQKGEQAFQQRFPNHQRLGYIRLVDSLAIVLLNSNFKTLTAADRLQQKKWL